MKTNQVSARIAANLWVLLVLVGTSANARIGLDERDDCEYQEAQNDPIPLDLARCLTEIGDWDNAKAAWRKAISALEALPKPQEYERYGRESSLNEAKSGLSKIGDKSGEFSPLFFPLAISLFSPVQIWPNKFLTVTGISLNAMYAHPYRVYGFDLGVVSNVTRSTLGVQAQFFVGFASLARGLQICGLVCASDSGWGISAAGLVTASKSFSGLSIAPLVNYGTVAGIQLAGLTNFSPQFSGFQFSLFNNVYEGVSGIQIGLLNLNNIEIVDFGSVSSSSYVVGNLKYTSTTVLRPMKTQAHAGINRGVFIGLLLNISDDTSGLQLGLFNSARELNGMQFGAVNISDATNGVQIGVVNVTRVLKGFQLGLVNVAKENGLPFMLIALAGW
jgi:hypothetical protein